MALMFTDDMVPNLFQVTFTLISTIGFKKGLNCWGLSDFDFDRIFDPEYLMNKFLCDTSR